MSAPASLLERVKAATGPDRQLGVDLTLTLNPPPAGQTYVAEHDFVDIEGDEWIILTGGEGEVECTLNPTASIDAALAVLWQALPDWRPRLTMYVFSRPPNLPNPHWRVQLQSWEREADAFAPTAPLAILAALLTALQPGAQP